MTHTPKTKTITQYGEPVDLTDQCELYDGGFVDLSNTVIKTTTTRSTVLGFAAGGYVTAMLDAGKSVNPSLDGEVEQVTEHEFDEKDRPLKTITETYEPFFVYAGRMSLQWVFDGSHVDMGNEKLLVERTVEEVRIRGRSDYSRRAKARPRRGGARCLPTGAPLHLPSVGQNTGRLAGPC